MLQENNLNLNVGVNFFQQERGSESVLDGAIFQEEFKIAIETKLFDNFSTEQLKHHIKSLSAQPGKNRILLALSKSEISNEIKSQVIACIKEMNSEIKFASASFSGLIELVKENVAEYEVDFHGIIDEFREFCTENELFKDESEYMLVVTAGTSIKENLEFGIYYDPVYRNHNTDFRFIGLYSNKAIVAIGEVLHCVWADLVDNKLEIKNDVSVPEAIKQRIKEIIIKTSYYDIQEGHKFYVVDAFTPTNYVKRSPGSLRGKTYFRVLDLPGWKPGVSTVELAQNLYGKEWD
ncbi:MAG TPA: hypothetical protein VK452_11790 [Dissulfurispiraceae bacterium]|nr:hypothetical protein [Dissulfurispiraceae bacterium]